LFSHISSYYINIMSYGKYSIAINNGIRDGDAGKLHNNQAVREYAYNKYREMGLNAHQAQGRMDHKDAGHIIAKNCGGKNTATNYMWEDRHDNRAHGDDKIKKQDLKRGGRW
jgi:hypothetical protein